VCICLSVCLSVSAHAVIGCLKLGDPTSNMVFSFMYTEKKIRHYLHTGCMGKLHVLCIAAVV
jgi:hypothetical protein